MTRPATCLRLLAVWLIFGLPAFLSAASPKTDPSLKPNILLILADDLGYEKLGCYGGLKTVTPNLDRMAEQGVLFTRAYTSPVCTPSRMSLYTGTYTPRHCYTSVLPVHKGTKKAVDFRKWKTYAQALRGAGYATSVTGKWQLATLEHHPDHIRVAGFDSWCIWQIWRNGAKTTRYWKPVFNRDGRVRDDIADRFGPDVLSDYVIEQMRAAQKADKPFLIHHNMMLPHWPIVQTPEDRKRSRSASLEGMIRCVDRQVGRILKAVQALETKRKTFVFFIGDNGTDEKKPRPTKAGEVTGGKTTLNDGGAHVPLIAWGSGVPKPGRRVDDLVDMADFFRSFCELAGADVPKGAAPDSLSFAGPLRGTGPGERRWVTSGVGKDFFVFDGSWRLHKSGKLFDCRKLPLEKPAGRGPDAKAARERLQPVVSRLGSLKTPGP